MSQISLKSLTCCVQSMTCHFGPEEFGYLAFQNTEAFSRELPMKRGLPAILLTILVVPSASETKYSLCIYACKDADSGQMFSYQKCTALGYGIMACPPMPECPAFKSDPFPMASQEQCEQFDCSHGKTPYNTRDKTACNGKLPPPQPPSPPPPPHPDPEACKKASLEVYKICSGEEKKLTLGYVSVPLDCASFCSGKVKLPICGQSMPCCAGPDCLQECMKLLPAPVCAMTRAEAKELDVFSHTCLYYPYEQPDSPNWCYKEAEIQSMLSTAAIPLLPPVRPKFKEYLGLKGLREPGLISGKHYRQELDWAHPKTGKVVQLHYDVQHGALPVFALDESEVVLGVRCMGPWVKLLVSSSDVPSILQELTPHTILAGGREWQCRQEGQIRSILHRILEVKRDAEGVLLKTEAASISDVFQHANISLRVAAFPPGHIHEHAWAGGPKVRRPEASLTADRVIVGGWWDAVCGALKAAWHAITGVARVVENVVEDIGRVAKAVATGDFSYQKHLDLASMSWNYDPSSKQVRNRSIDLGSGLSCEECFFDMEASVNFDLVIKSYQVDHAAVWMEGDAQVLLDAGFDSSSAIDEFHLATVHLDDICTTIAGIPFCLQASMMVDAGFNVTSGSSSGRNHARLSASGHIKKGLLYQQNEVHRIDEGSLEPLSDSRFIDVKASEYVGLNLFPKLVLTVDHIGGPIVGIKTTLEAITEVSSQECSGPGIYAALNLGLQFSVGGFLSVKVPVVGVEVWNKSFPSLLSLSHSFPIVSGCHALGDSGLLEMEGAQPLKNGVVFSGTLPPVSSGAPWCAGSPPLLVAYQISSFAAADGDCDLGGVKSCPQVARGQSSRWSVPVEGGLQGYNPFAYGQEELATTGRTFAPMTDTNRYIRYQQTSEEGKGLPAITYNVEVSSDLSSMTLSPVNSGSCYSEATLYRNAKAAKTAEAAKQVAKQAGIDGIIV